MSPSGIGYTIERAEVIAKDNEFRLNGCHKNGMPFRLIGEDARLDGFSNKTKLKYDKDMKLLLDKVVDTVSSSVQQVFDIAYNSRPRKEITLAEIGNKIPQVDIYWRTLPKKRSRTHALEIWPKKSGKTTQKPLYKFHADYDGKERKFKNPLIVKRSRSSKWRRVWLSLDVDWFTPGEGLANEMASGRALQNNCGPAHLRRASPPLRHKDGGQARHKDGGQARHKDGGQE